MMRAEIKNPSLAETIVFRPKWIATPPGAFCIFFPEDAHAPLVSAGNIRKVIFKIAVDAGNKVPA